MRNNKKRISIMCSCNDPYAKHFGALICSIFENTKNKDNIKIYLVDIGISKKNKSKINFLINQYGGDIEYLKVDEKIQKEFAGINLGRYGLASALRIFMFSKIPADKFIYLDCDIIVKGDITELYNINLENKILGSLSDTYSQKEVFNILKIPKNKNYFNTGVLLIDKLKWKERNICKKIFKEINLGKKYSKNIDQDILNCVLYDNWKEINPSWNVVTNAYEGIMMKKSWGVSKEKFKVILKNPKIIHFTGEIKPWHYLSVHPLKKEYWRYLKKPPGKILNIKIPI